MARWRLEKHERAASHWIEARRYVEREDQKLSISQFYSNPHGPGTWKTITLDWWDCYNFPDLPDFLIETLIMWRREIRRRKQGKRRDAFDE